MHRTTLASHRLYRERRTIRIMIEIYCRAEHRLSDGALADGLCPECVDLYDYASRRIEHCRFGAKKPVCAKCPVRCYKPEMRAQIRSVMRYAGPRMLFSHPWLTMLHALDRARRVPSTQNSSV